MRKKITTEITLSQIVGDSTVRDCMYNSSAV